jgi:hypothetical protein
MIEEAAPMSDWNDEQTEKMSDEDKKVYGDYEGKMRAESDVRTLTDAQEIKRDKKRMKMAVHCAKYMMDAMKDIQ